MQLTDKDGNIFGIGGLEITTSSGKPKVPIINTDITIGTTAIVNGVSGRILFEGAGNVVQESENLTWDNTNSIFTLTRLLGPTMRLNVQASNTSKLQFTQELSVGVPTEIGYISNQFGTGMILQSYNSIYFNPGNVERMRFAPTTGNVLIGTTTDAGYKLDVNGSTRVSGTLWTDNISPVGSTLYIYSVGASGVGGYNRLNISYSSTNGFVMQSDGGAGGSRNMSIFGGGPGGSLNLGTNGTSRWTLLSSYDALGPGHLVPVGSNTYDIGTPTNTVRYLYSNLGRFSGSLNAATNLAQGVSISNTLVATANNDVLVGLDVQPTFTNGAFTGVSNFAARFGGDVVFTSGNRNIRILSPSTTGDGGSIVIAAGNATTSGTGGSITLSEGLGAGGPGRGSINIGTSGYTTVNIGGANVTVTNSGPNTGTAFRVLAGGQNGLSIYWDNLTPFMQYGLVSGRQSRFVNSTSYTFSSKVFIGTNTDAGYNFDVNGTARIANSLRLAAEITPSASAFVNAPLVSYVTSSGWAAGNRPGISFWGDAYSGAFLYFDGSLTFKAINDAGLSMTFASTSYVLANQPWAISGSNISYTAGNVGIGSSTAPYYPLQITQSTINNYIELSGTTNKGLYASGSGLLNWDPSGNMNFYTGGVNLRATISSAGNFLIGTSTDAGFKLDVNGSSRIIGAATGTIGSRVLTLEGSLPELFFKDTFAEVQSFALSKYGSAFYFSNTSSTGTFVNYAGAIVSQSWSLGHGGNPSATVHVKGAGNNSSTTSLKVQNSAGVDILTVRDDMFVSVKNTNNTTCFEVVGVNTDARILFTPSGGTSNIFLKSQGSTLTLSTTANSFADVRAGYAVQHLRIGVAAGNYGGNLYSYVGDSSNGFYWRTINGSSVEVDKMLLTTGGNLLIGTTTDAGYKLDVNGTQRVQVSSAGIPNILSISNLQTDAGPGGAIAFYTGGVVGNASRIVAQRSGSVGQSDIALETNGVRRLFVSANDGNVGIGTTTLGTSTQLTIGGAQTASSAIARGILLNTSLTQSIANDVLTAVQITPTLSVNNTLFHEAYWLRLTGSYTPASYTSNNNATTIDLSNSFTNTFNAIGIRIRHTYSNVQYGYGILLESVGQIGIAQTSSISNNFFAGTTVIGNSVIAPASGYSLHVTNNTNGAIKIGNVSDVSEHLIISHSQAGATFSSIRNTYVNTGAQMQISVGGQDNLRLFGTGNVTVGGTTDAGYKLDVNGNTRIQGNTTLTGTLTMGNGSFSYSANPNNWFTISGNQGLILNQANGNNGSIVLGASNSANFTVALTNTTMYGVSISRPVTPIAGSTNLTYNSLEIDNVINYTNATNSIVRGLYIHPTLTSVTDFRAIETTVGNVLFGSNFFWDNTNGRLGIGTSSPTVALDIVGVGKFSTNLNVGSTTFTSTATPNFISLGATYGDGTNFGTKIKLLDSGATQWGIGISSATGINYFGAQHNFYGSVSTEVVKIFSSTSNTSTATPSFIDLGSSFSSTAGANPKLRLFGTSYAIGMSAGAVEYFAPKHVFYTGNVLINTTTDAGFRLDVNGSARVQSGLTVSGSLNLNSSDISSAWTAYTPAWTSNGTQPSLGDGSIRGYYKIVGKTCFVRVRLALGTTSTGGTGHWLFSLPVPAVDPDTIQFACSMLDNGFAWYQGTVNGTYAGHTDKTAIIALSGGGANSSEAVTATRPFTWGSTDSLQFNGSYEIA